MARRIENRILDRERFDLEDRIRLKEIELDKTIEDLQGAGSGDVSKTTPGSSDTSNDLALWHSDGTLKDSLGLITFDTATFTISCNNTTFTAYVKIDNPTSNFHLRNSTDLVMYAPNDSDRISHSLSASTYDLSCVPGSTFTMNVSANFIGVKFNTYIQPDTETSTNLNDVTHAINTAAGKIQGAMVFNTTTNNPVYAVGSAASDQWVDGAGTVVHSPA